MDGAGVSFADVSITVSLTSAGTRVRLSTSSDKSGSYSFMDSRLDGAKGVVVSVTDGRGLAGKIQHIENVASGSIVTVKPLVAWKIFAIFGDVTTSDDKPATNVAVHLVGEFQPGRQSQYAATTSNGKYAFPTVQAGKRYQISINNPEFEVVGQDSITIDALIEDTTVNFKGDFNTAYLNIRTVLEQLLATVGAAAICGLAALAWQVAKNRGLIAQCMQSSADAETVVNQMTVNQIVVANQGSAFASARQIAALRADAGDVPLENLPSQSVRALQQIAARGDISRASIGDSVESISATSESGEAASAISEMSAVVEMDAQAVATQLSGNATFVNSSVEAVVESAAQADAAVVIPDAIPAGMAFQGIVTIEAAEAMAANGAGASVSADAVVGIVEAGSEEESAGLVQALLDMFLLVDG